MTCMPVSISDLGGIFYKANEKEKILGVLKFFLRF